MEKVKINCEALKKWVKEQDKTSAEMSFMLGKSKSYLSNVYCVYTPYMSKAGYELFLRTFNLPENSFRVAELFKPMPAETPKHTGYWLDLRYSPSVVQVRLLFGDELVACGRSKVKDDTELAFVQAVSYAAHMCYKAKEQAGLDAQMNEEAKGNVH